MKQFKILRIYASCPCETIFEKFYADRNLDNRSYSEAIGEFCKQGVIIPGSWCASMKKLGHDAIDVVPDCYCLQKKWATENGIEMPGGSYKWKLPILFKQIEILKPEVIFFYAGGWSMLSDDLRRQLKSKFPFIKVVTGLWGDALPANENYSKFSDVDFLFCAYHYILNDVRKRGISADFYGNSFDPIFADHCENIPVKHDFIFAGTSGYSSPTHLDRYLGLIKLLENTDLKIWAYEPYINKWLYMKNFLRDSLTKGIAVLPKEWLEKLNKKISNPSVFTNLVDKCMNAILQTEYENRVQRLIGQALKPHTERYGIHNWDLSLKPLKTLFPARVFPSKFGLEYFETLKSAKIVFNCHTNEAPHAGNIRVFEVTGLGSCLLTNNASEAKHLFDIDNEIVGYSSFEEAIEKVKYLLSHEEKRKEIADKGRERTLKNHTVMHRCQLVHDVLQKF